MVTVEEEFGKLYRRRQVAGSWRWDENKLRGGHFCVWIYGSSVSMMDFVDCIYTHDWVLQLGLEKKEILDVIASVIVSTSFLYVEIES